MGNETDEPIATSTGVREATKARGNNSDRMLHQLRDALKRDGDFPANAHAIEELNKLAAEPSTSAEQITELILKDPSLSTRLLHVVNGPKYNRSKPIMTVSQAVIQLGVQPIVELFSDLKLQPDLAVSQEKNVIYQDSFKKTICTSLLSSSLMPALNDSESRDKELGYLTGSFSELGTLLLAHYFPRTYSTATNKAITEGQGINLVLKDITGINPYGLSLEAIKTLDLPAFYKNIVHSCTSDNQPDESSGDFSKIANSIKVSQDISSVLVFDQDEQRLKKIVEDADKNYGITGEALHSALGELPGILRDHCSSLNIELAPLPDFVHSYARRSFDIIQPGLHERINSFIDEIRGSIERGEPSAAIITSVMETIAWGLRFDRVMLLLASPNNTLVGRMILGNSKTEPRSIVRSLGADAGKLAPDAMAFRESRPVFKGQSIFHYGNPVMAIPVGFGDRRIGVIYADRISVDLMSPEITEREREAVTVLANLIDRTLQSRTEK